MERIAPSHGHGSVASTRMMVDGAASIVHGGYYRSERISKVAHRSDEFVDECRDDPASQRWDRQRGFAVAMGHNLSRDRNARGHYEGRPYPIPQHHHSQRHWQHYRDPRWYRGAGYHGTAPYSTGGMIPVSCSEEEAHPNQSAPYSSGGLVAGVHASPSSRVYQQINRIKSSNPRSSPARIQTSVVVIPKNITIPNEITTAPVSMDISPTEHSLNKRSSSDSSESSASPPQSKRSKTSEVIRPGAGSAGGFNKLDLLCAATLDLGPLQENPAGCSCPKSKCVALYCDCFKAGRRCSPTTCSCLNCKNTIEESGPNGARSKAIQSILARNPRAFTNARSKIVPNKLPPGEACNCTRSRCLKLYCTCFQAGKTCDPNVCTCVGCLNTENDAGGYRKAAIETTLEKRPDAFGKPKPKEIGSGCACKNNRCIRKYCECFRTGLACTKRCSCRDCENPGNQAEHATSSKSTV